jgi:hypothetical protein
MQQPTGAIRMSTILNVKILSPAPCENNTLFRDALVLPKIVHSYPSRSSVVQSLPILVPVSGQYRYKLSNKALYSPACRWKKQRSDY